MMIIPVGFSLGVSHDQEQKNLVNVHAWPE